MTLSTMPVTGIRAQTRERRPGRPPSGKRLATANIRESGKLRSTVRRSLDPCDNSNDSGLGFDHHTEHQLPPYQISERLGWSSKDGTAEQQSCGSRKRQKLDGGCVKMEHDETNDRYCFPDTIISRNCKENTALIRTAPVGSIPSLAMNNSQSTTSGRAVARCTPLTNRQSTSSSIPLTTQLVSNSRYSEASLSILKQPEQQHRARYQTEGSRGAVKDREGNGFPVVQLTGYYQPSTLQVFIGTDVGKVAPHMFYQACKVSGKNSTPCSEKKLEGTCVIELQLDPSKEMSATCDCVGILKERNVDVEHRFPDQLGNRSSKKKSTRCRMIFRTTLTHENGVQETLQVCSQPIVCTQPPGVPEICKKSLSSCPATGGLELFVLGKNFLKDTKVYFQLVDDDRQVRWELAVVPDKEYLQQTHFVCVVPPYVRQDTIEPVTVRLFVMSSGKTSEPHQFVYTPVNGAIPSVLSPPSTTTAPFFNKMMTSWPCSKREQQDVGMMPPPESSLVPMTPRRPSISIPSCSSSSSSCSSAVAARPDAVSPPLRCALKQEFIQDENSQNSLMDCHEVAPTRYRHLSECSLDVQHGDSINDNSIDLLSHSSMSNDDVITRHNSFSDESCNAVMSLATQPSAMLRDELKVMDLRMKMTGTVADLVSSSAPSMATLQSFGMTEPSTLTPQSVQSIENFLTNIETSTTSSTPTDTKHHQVFQGRPLDQINQLVVAKSEAAAIAESITQHTTTTTMDTQKLDQLINSTIESHIHHSTSPQINTNHIINNNTNTTDVIRDVMMATPLVVATTTATSLLSADLAPTTEAILNSQLSPSMMCRSGPQPVTAETGLLSSAPVDAPVVSLLTQSPPATSIIVSDPEKVVLLKAAVDLLETQQKLSQLESASPKINMMDGIMTSGAGTGRRDSGTFLASGNVQDNVIPIPVKEMGPVGVAPTTSVKSEQDGMIPQSFTALTENELINLINPNCFDQGNNNAYQ